jgi:hypothetical protein
MRNKIRVTSPFIKSIVDSLVAQQKITYKLDNRLIMNAATEKNFEKLKYLHSRMGLKINYLVLNEAVESGCSVQFVEYLCMNGADTSYSIYKAVERFELLKVVQKYGGWGNNETSIPTYYASRGDLDKLKWVRNHGCSWNESAMRIAVSAGHLNVVKYCHENKCPHNSDLKFYAAYHGRLHVLEYLHEKGYPWGDTLNGAVENDRVDILKWAIEHGCPTNNRVVCWNAAARGSLRCLKYAHESGCPWDNTVLSIAQLKKHRDCVKYALENGLIEDDE